MRGFTLFVVSAFVFASTALQATYDEEKQLAHLSQLIGGKWWRADSRYITFEWGLAKTQIKLTQVVLNQGREEVVAEGIFYYSPDTFSIKGISTSVSNSEPPQLLEYIGTASSTQLEFMYKSISPNGVVQVFSETWSKVNEDTFNWQLESFDSEQPILVAEYVRTYGK